ncbi:hypothetical protein B0H13DRAFT_2377532 [Mycena leptocephala]|nr:hypothetical protein B0H13DRAFT_2377532 [Mycena leptocephala]
MAEYRGYSSFRDHNPYQLPARLTGLNRHPSGYIFVNPMRPGLDLDDCVYLRVIRVGEPWSRAGLEFWRSTCYQYLSLPPGSAEDFILPHPIRPRCPINMCILPPTDRDSALRSVSYASGGPPTTFPVLTIRRGAHVTSLLAFGIEREEGFLDSRYHVYDIFCAVFLAEDGAYEVAQLYSSDGRPVITETSLIFAPSAWNYGARVLANRGRLPGRKNRLLCGLESGNLILLDVDSSFVAIQEGWASVDASGCRW